MQYSGPEPADISILLRTAMQMIHTKRWDHASLLLNGALIAARKLPDDVVINRVRRGFIAQAIEAVEVANHG